MVWRTDKERHSGRESSSNAKERKEKCLGQVPIHSPCSYLMVFCLVAGLPQREAGQQSSLISELTVGQRSVVAVLGDPALFQGAPWARAILLSEENSLDMCGGRAQALGGVSKVDKHLKENQGVFLPS